jgi:cytochrome b subunit of formate dehydrogenase
MFALLLSYSLKTVKMSSSDTNLTISLNNISTAFNSYLSIFIFIFALIGNMLNILVLSQRKLRSNPSATFFLASSIAGIIVILSGLTSRMMSDFGKDLTLTVDWICKIRNFILYASRTILLWMIILATIDRWLSSSVAVHMRQMSSLKNTRRSMLLVLIYTCLINAPILYCYEANLTGVLRGCYGFTYACRLTTDLIYAFGTTLIPLSLMIMFGLLTIRNVRHVQSRVRTLADITWDRDIRTTITTKSSGQTQAKKMDRQLLKMLLVQVTLLLLLTGPHAIQKVYTSFSSTPPSNSLQSSIQNLIFNIFTLMSFTGSGIPFYIYTLTGGSLFRTALVDIVKTMMQKLFCH